MRHRLRMRLACVLAALLVHGCSDAPVGDVAEPVPQDGQGGAPGSPDSNARLAPDFELESLAGERIRLSELRGKTVVIDFWATWCPPCEFQVPELNAFYEAHKQDGDVEVLGISVDVDGAEAVGGWVGEKQVRYKVLLGGEDLARRYGALGFPTLYVVAPDGTVDSEHVGLIETGDLEAALARQRAGAAG